MSAAKPIRFTREKVLATLAGRRLDAMTTHTNVFDDDGRCIGRIAPTATAVALGGDIAAHSNPHAYPDVCILSADLPGITDRGLAARRLHLGRWLEGGNYRFQIGRGVYNGLEETCFVVNDNGQGTFTKDMKKLGKAYGQESILLLTGTAQRHASLEFLDGRTPSRVDIGLWKRVGPDYRGDYTAIGFHRWACLPDAA